jgi:hypothetical protein
VLACSHSRGGPGRPTVVHFHGSGEVVGDWREGLPRWLDDRGFDLLDARLVIGRETRVVRLTRHPFAGGTGLRRRVERNAVCPSYTLG